MKQVVVVSLAIAIVVLAAPQDAEAYVGPGAGITAVGALISLFGAVLLAIVGFIWYPIKRWRAKSKRVTSEINAGPRTS